MNPESGIVMIDSENLPNQIDQSTNRRRKISKKFNNRGQFTEINSQTTRIRAELKREEEILRNLSDFNGGERDEVVGLTLKSAKMAREINEQDEERMCRDCMEGSGKDLGRTLD